MIDLVFQTVLALAFVVFLIYVLAQVQRRRSRGGGLIDVLEYKSLGQKVVIAAIKVGDEVLVFGITPTDFRLLKKIGRRNGGDGIAPEGGAEGPSPQHKKGMPSALLFGRAKKTAGCLSERWKGPEGSAG